MSRRGSITASSVLTPSDDSDTRGDAPRPTLLVVDGDDASRAVLARELRTRYGVDYTVLVESSPVTALQHLRELSVTGEEVAVILADREMGEMPGIPFLVTAHEIHPQARRGLLVTPTQDLVSRREVARACVLGVADCSLIKPVQARDERFHRDVTEFLDQWWRARASTVEVFRVVDEERSPRAHEIRDLLQRHDLRYGFYASESEAGRAVLVQAGAEEAQLPVVVMLDGRVLSNPTNREVAEALGAGVRPSDVTYDVVIVGGGPAGLAAAVYAGSEGLRTALVEGEALGGQAGTSSLIRNYLGFPRGISGAELAARAVDQAVLFGTDIVYGSTATALRPEGDRRVLTLDDDVEIHCRAVVIATGVSYRRLQVPELEALVGTGVFYGAGMSEAQALSGQPVFVVGGGNSAGQAALHLSRYAERVTVLVRSGSLATSMSHYLITDLTIAPNIAIRYGVEVVGGGGEGRLERLELKDRQSGAVESVPAAALFVLIGAEPFTDWLPSSVRRDQWGYVLTGTQTGIGGLAGTASESVSDSASSDRPRIRRDPLLLETSLAGVFAVGDVRHGSVKRVASSAGDGSMCIRLVHEYLEAAAEQRHQPASSS